MAWYDIGLYVFLGGLGLFGLYLLWQLGLLVLSIRQALKDSKLPVETAETKYGTFTRQGKDSPWFGEMEFRGGTLEVTLPERPDGPDPKLLQQAEQILKSFGPYDEAARTYLSNRLKELNLDADEYEYELSSMSMRPSEGVDFELNYGSEPELVILEFVGREVRDHTTVS